MILTRYVLRQFASTFAFSLFALSIIFIIVNLIEQLGDFLDANATVKTIALYYLNTLPFIVKMLAPVSMLLASLFAIGQMSNRNEITAMKAGGMSIWRLLVPLLALSCFFSIGQLYFNGWIVPSSNTRKLNIERKYLNKGAVSPTLMNLFFRDSPLRNVTFGNYDSETKTGNIISIQEFSSETAPRLTERFDAQSATWSDSLQRWYLRDVRHRVFRDSSVIYRKLEGKWVDFQVRHDQLIKLQKSTDEMNFEELREYIAIQERGGKDTRASMIDYFGQYAFPFSNIIVVLFGVPFASVRKKGGIAIEITAALVVSFVYLAFTKISQSLGLELPLSPALIGWSANILFTLLGIVNLIRLR